MCLSKIRENGPGLMALLSLNTEDKANLICLRVYRQRLLRLEYVVGPKS